RLYLANRAQTKPGRRRGPACADHAGCRACVCPRWPTAWNCGRQSRPAAGVRSHSRDRPPEQPYLRCKRFGRLPPPFRIRIASSVFSSVRLQDEYPGLMELLRSDDTTPRLIDDRFGERVGVAWQKLRLGGGPRVATIETLPYGPLIAGATTIRDSSALAALAAVLVAMILAVIIARSMTQPLGQMTRAVETFTVDQPGAGPPEAG